MDKAGSHRSPLEAVLSDLKISAEDAAKAIKASLEDVKKWVAGDAISADHVKSLALLTGRPRCDFVESTMSEWSQNEYVGNVGLKLRGREKTMWFPIGSEDRDRLREAAENRRPAFVEGRGGSALLVFPYNLQMMTILDDDEDMVVGDWDIDPIDGVEGVNPEAFDSVRDGDMLLSPAQRRENAASEWYVNTLDAVHQSLGGIGEVEEFLDSYRIYFKDGTAYKASTIDAEDDLRQLCIDIETDDLNLDEMPVIGALDERFINLDEVAFIRLPNLILRNSETT